MVQALLRKTQSFVGARSSCSIGGPRKVSISFSLRPINRSTPWVPIEVASPAGGGVAARASVGGATTLYTGAGCGAGSGAGITSAALAWSELLGRNSAGGPDSTQPTTSSGPTTLIRCRPLQPLILLLPPVSMIEIERCAPDLRHFTIAPQNLIVSPSPPRMAPGWAQEPRQGSAAAASVAEYAMRIWPK
jgi:hypothetical protein